MGLLLTITRPDHDTRSYMLYGPYFVNQYWEDVGDSTYSLLSLSKKITVTMINHLHIS